METVDRVTLRCLAKSEHFERKLGKRFVISDNVSSNRVAGHNSAEVIDALKILQAHRPDWDACGALSRLPGEVLLDIFDSVGHAPSQISFCPDM